MKKLTVFAAALLLLTMLFGCAGKSSGVELYSKGLDMIDRMATLADSAEYIRFMSPSEEIKSIANDIAWDDYSKPEAVYAIEPGAGALESVFKALEAVDSEMYIGMDDAVKAEMEGKMLASLYTRINALAGAATVAATSVLSVQDSFISSLKENAIYLYVFDSDYYALVSYKVCGNGVVSASAGFVVSNGLKEAGSASELSDWLEENDLLFDCEITELSQPAN